MRNFVVVPVFEENAPSLDEVIVKAMPLLQKTYAAFKAYEEKNAAIEHSAHAENFLPSDQ